MKTGEDVYRAALALLFEDDSTAGDYRSYARPLLNILLMECFEANNSLREAAGKAPLVVATELKALEEETGYEDVLCVRVLPYGLAAKLVLDDGDMGKVSMFQSLYTNALNECIKWLPENVRDVYA